MNSFSSSELQRYSRQLNLPGFGLEEQKNLKEAKVLVIGCGGLGSPLIMNLAASGIGTLGIADFDKIELHNLHRQILFGEGDLGKFKVEVAKHKVASINSDISCISFNTKIDADNAIDIISQFDIVADGTDNFSTRYLVNDCCVKLGKTNVFASILRYEGQLSVFNYKDENGEFGPNYRDLFLNPPEQNLVPNCADGGILGPVAGTLASMQAVEVLKIAAGLGTEMSGKLLNIDLLSMEVLKLTFKKNPDNPVRYKNRDQIVLKDIEEYCVADTKGEMLQISVAELKEMIENEEVFQLIDVREKHEFDLQNLNGLNIPLSTLLIDQSLIKDKSKVVIHCQTGKRSQLVIRKLKEQGFETPLYNLEGGINAWLNLLHEV